MKTAPPGALQRPKSGCIELWFYFHVLTPNSLRPRLLHRSSSPTFKWLTAYRLECKGLMSAEFTGFATYIKRISWRNESLLSVNTVNAVTLSPWQQS